MPATGRMTRKERELVRRVENLTRTLAALGPRSDDGAALVNTVDRLKLQLAALRERRNRRSGKGARPSRSPFPD
jgi:hypothetical protein